MYAINTLNMDDLLPRNIVPKDKKAWQQIMSFQDLQKKTLVAFLRKKLREKTVAEKQRNAVIESLPEDPVAVHQAVHSPKPLLDDESMATQSRNEQRAAPKRTGAVGSDQQPATAQIQSIDEMNRQTETEESNQTIETIRGVNVDAICLQPVIAQNEISQSALTVDRDGDQALDRVQLIETEIAAAPPRESPPAALIPSKQQHTETMSDRVRRKAAGKRTPKLLVTTSCARFQTRKPSRGKRSPKRCERKAVSFCKSQSRKPSDSGSEQRSHFRHRPLSAKRVQKSRRRRRSKSNVQNERTAIDAALALSNGSFVVTQFDVDLPAESAENSQSKLPRPWTAEKVEAQREKKRARKLKKEADLRRRKRRRERQRANRKTQRANRKRAIRKLQEISRPSTDYVAAVPEMAMEGVRARWEWLTRSQRVCLFEHSRF
jgi:hypothetical protein